MVADKLPLPAAMVFGPDGNLYLSTGGSRARFEGQIMRLRMPPAWLGPLRGLLPWIGGVALAGLVAIALTVLERRRKRRPRPARRRRVPSRAAPA